MDNHSMRLRRDWVLMVYRIDLHQYHLKDKDT